jgi:hypothetical protein
MSSSLQSGEHMSRVGRQDAYSAFSRGLDIALSD